MRSDPLLRLALALHESPGVYALLVGSGVSRAAGIPTGWDIVLDLVRKVAAVEGEDPAPDPEAWYQQKFDEAPTYTALLERLTSTSAERMNLLRSYFEPTDEEREQGLKVPTPAHKAIARLVKDGHVRVILTTNFDRLLEAALDAEAIQPDVIASDDALRGAMPHVHTRCVVVKLHGDYRDTRIRNTPAELERYSRAMNRFLDRVFDEFGLIVCGWSGTWDTALRDAILRCPTRRFTTFWFARRDLTDEASGIVQHRRAEAINIESADQVFQNLLERLESLRELERPHPLSTAEAVVTAKRYVAESRHRVRLHDLIHEETEAVWSQVASDEFTTHVQPFTQEVFVRRLRRYEAVTEQLMATQAALAYHDIGDNAYLFVRCIERLVRPLRADGLTALLDFQYYPALLVSYAAGLSALAANRYSNLAAVLREPQWQDPYNREQKPALYVVNVPSVFGQLSQWIPRPRQREHTAGSNHIFDLLRPLLKDYLPDDAGYEETFDLFECLLGLTYLDLVRDNWAPVGRFGWRWRRWKPEDSPVTLFVRAGLAEGADWDFLKAGFFGGSVDRLNEILERHREWLAQATQSWV